MRSNAFWFYSGTAVRISLLFFFLDVLWLISANDIHCLNRFLQCFYPCWPSRTSPNASPSPLPTFCVFMKALPKQIRELKSEIVTIQWHARYSGWDYTYLRGNPEETSGWTFFVAAWVIRGALQQRKSEPFHSRSSGGLVDQKELFCPNTLHHTLFRHLCQAIKVFEVKVRCLRHVVTLMETLEKVCWQMP